MSIPLALTKAMWTLLSNLPGLHFISPPSPTSPCQGLCVLPQGVKIFLLPHERI